MSAVMSVKAASAKASNKPRRSTRLLQGLLLPALVLIVWEIVSRQGPNYAYAFVPIADILRSVVEVAVSGELAFNLLATLKNAVLSLLIGGTIGLLFGSLMALSKPVDLLLGPLYHAWRQVPLLGLVPLITLWFGNTEFAKLFVVSLATFEVMVLNSYEGLRNAEKQHVEVAHVLTLSRLQRFRYVLLPGATPAIFTGLLQAIAFAWLAAIGVELLFAAGPGISALMERAQLAARMDIVIVCVALIALMGFGMHHLCEALSRRLLRWRNVWRSP
jgi:sulfonate transport system permease protein